MSVCAKFQLSSWSRSAWKVCGWRFHGLYVRFHGLYAFQVTTKSNPTKLLLSCFELSWVELSYIGFWHFKMISWRRPQKKGDDLKDEVNLKMTTLSKMKMIWQKMYAPHLSLDFEFQIKKCWVYLKPENWVFIFGYLIFSG